MDYSVGNSTYPVGNGIYRPGGVDASGQWHGSTIGAKPRIANPNGYESLVGVAPTPAGVKLDSNPFNKEEEKMEQEYIVGNGKTTSFTFPTTENYPGVAVYTRVVEGEDDEQTTTVTELGSDAVTVSITQGEQITVEFSEAPSRRGAVILIG